jgi:hypothetical protein
MSKTIVGLIAASMLGVPPALEHVLIGKPVPTFPGHALAADAAHPDWPCVQRKVTALSTAQMWDGGDVDDLTQWRDDQQMGKVIALLASRRVPLEQAAAAVAEFADGKPPDQRDDALKQLFAGLLDAINRDRAVVMSGIERFQQRQRARAAEIERQGAAIHQLKERAASDERARAELAAAEDRYNWDVRVFTERQQSLPLACEIPVLIEQRLFALGREIRQRMND